MYGLNVVVVSGNVGKMTSGKTKTEQDAVSLKIAINKVAYQKNVTWVRINVYGSLARRVLERVQKGDYIAIEGELMNRKIGKDNKKQVVDIRCRDIIFISKKPQDDIEAPSDDDGDGEVVEE